MLIGIPKESLVNETRVAATPTSVKQLLKLGFDVVVEQGAGIKANFDDNAWTEAGARVVDSEHVWQADILLKVNVPNESEIAFLRPKSTLISFIWPAQQQPLLQRLAERDVTVMAMDCVPRISRAQSLDALSAMGCIAGYRAVVEASHVFGRFFPGQITAAGKIAAAEILVIGAGVVGLTAIGVASNMGANVRAFDTRPEVKEQVESVGAKFLPLKFAEKSAGGSDGYAKEMSPEFIAAEMTLFAAQAQEVDIIITTALIPGKPAPRLITKEMIMSMKPGSVIVDLAAQTGGNCELTVADQIITTENGVKIIGYTDLPARLPAQSSQLYATNLLNLLKLLCPEKNGEINVNLEDVVVRGVTVVNEGKIIWPAPPIPVSMTQSTPRAASAPAKPPEKPGLSMRKKGFILAGALLAVALFNVLPAAFLSHFTVLMLACVVGYYVVWNVNHALHTPLMSVTNAISGIIVVGAMLQTGSGGLVSILAFIAVLIASINVFGGFTVTQRMLKMFRKK